ncbi:ornithine carbamoyltransferase [Leptolyngbya cf. ectocarpi LEGE 11479]|uniref:Ornithine carbamoyltransferase n=1 Tax=Leptolyngbya cf. ectocarpi LEGE 11479 TaxID=1828722 RepID=A0A928ZT31_LEPEC|nr:ornithine carbamoyltransferase [Leptolyngbya ectocarpi]MBE9066281.1 ornithine carbamoyltransferase [Leptolyngbya cf. ectocarpi LEGE 11479]
MDSLKGQDLLSMADLSSAELHGLLELAAQLKTGTSHPQCPNKVLGLVFSKASTRTRVSFSVAMYQLGGQVLDLNAGVTQVGRGEPTADTARVLDRYLDVVAIRTFQQSEIQEFADYATIPVINALTDLEHPCQILADLLTLKEAFGSLENLTMAYFGDGNNVAHSLMLGCALAGVNIRVATPEGYAPNQTVVDQAIRLTQGRSDVIITTDPQAAAEGSHALYTDVWASMGEESEAASRIPKFQPYQINQSMLTLADNQAIVMHCLPAHRGEEITHDVMEGPQSRLWDQAENRLHAQKALLAAILSAD